MVRVSKATVQTIMRKPNWTEKQVREALAYAGGIATEAARYLTDTYGRPCARNTISTYLAKSADLRSFQAECLETALDVAESALMRRIEQGDTSAIRFFLETKGKHRGYTRRVEAAAPRGREIGPRDEDDPREARAWIERKLEAIGARLRADIPAHPDKWLVAHPNDGVDVAAA
jgi:hypothetical protein